MKDPQRLESALRGLYQSGLLARPRIAFISTPEAILFDQSMQASKEALESDPVEMQQLRCNRCAKTVSTLVPDGTIIRAWVECPECLAIEIEMEEMAGLRTAASASDGVLPAATANKKDTDSSSHQGKT